MRDWPRATTQAGDVLRDLLARMGCTVALTRRPGSPSPAADGIEGLDADLHDVGELTPVLAALCALADGPSYLRGIAHIRGHETDRLAALATELRGLGADVTEHADGLELRPAHPARRACSAPTPTTGWRTPRPCSALPSTASRSTTSTPTEQDVPRLPRRLGRPAGPADDAAATTRTTTSTTSARAAGPGPAPRSGRRYDDAVEARRHHGRPGPVHAAGRRGQRLGRQGAAPGPQGRRRRRPRPRRRRRLGRRRRAGPDRRGAGADDRAAAYGGRRRPGRARGRRQRRPARRRHRAGRPRASPAADRPGPGGGVRRRG